MFINRKGRREGAEVAEGLNYDLLIYDSAGNVVVGDCSFFFTVEVAESLTY